MADAAQVDAMFGALKTRWGGLGVPVNNAGIAGPTAKVEETDLADWKQTIAVTVTGPGQLAKSNADQVRRARSMIEALRG